MYARSGDLSRRIESRDTALTVKIGYNAAAGEMLGWNHGNPVLFHFDANARESLVNCWKLVLQVLALQMCRVEINAPGLQPLHLALDRPRDNIPGSQLQAVIVVVHEPSSKVVSKSCPRSPDGFAYQETTKLSVVERCRVELHEFHVPNLGASRGRQCYSIRRGDPRVGRVLVHPTAATSGDHHGSREEADGALVLLECLHSHATALCHQQSGHKRLLEYGDLRMALHRLENDILYFPAGSVLCVDNSVPAVGSFKPKRKFAVELTVKWGTQTNQPSDRFGRLLD